MARAEMEQTGVDRFWGLDKLLKDIEEERDKMMEEERRSIALDNYSKKIQIVAIWEEADRQARLEEAYQAFVEEEYARKMYLEEFNAFANSLDVVRYEWPTKPHVRSIFKEDDVSVTDNTDFMIKQTFSGKSTVHVDGIQQAKVLAESLAASMTLQKSPVKKHLMMDEDEETPPPKINLQCLHSRASSPVLKTALESQGGIFDRPLTPLTRLVDAQTAADQAARESERASRGSGRPETISPINLPMTAQVRPRSPTGSKKGDGLFKSPHLRQLGEAYAAEEALIAKIETGSYIPALHGHKKYKWEQQVMLRLIFDVVVQENQHSTVSKTQQAMSRKPEVITYAQLIKSIATAVMSNNDNIAAVPEPRTATRSHTSKVKALRSTGQSSADLINGKVRPETPPEVVKVNILHLFKFTLFGTWIKRRDYDLFGLLFDVTPGHGGRALTLRDWLTVAKAAAHEDHMPSSKIRTVNEHKQVCCMEYRMELAEIEHKARQADALSSLQQADERAAKKLYAATARCFSIDKMPRDSGQLYRTIAVGDPIWAQYGGGVTWLPGVVARKYDEDQSFEVYYTLSEKEQMELQLQISSKIVIEGYYSHSDKVLEKSNAQLKKSLSLTIPGCEEVQEPSNVHESRRSSLGNQPIKPLTRPCSEKDDRSFFKYVFSQLTLNIPSHSGSFDTESLIQNLLSPQFRQLLGGSKILMMLIEGHVADGGAPDDAESEQEKADREAARKTANDLSLIGILSEQPSTSESEFVELCVCLSDVVVYQN